MTTNDQDLSALRETALRFAKRELEPKAIELDDFPFKEFNRAALKAAIETGLTKVTVPEDKGGSGQGMAALCEVLKELSRFDASFAAVLFVNALAQAALVKWNGPADLLVSDLIAFPAYDLPTELPRELVAEKKPDGWELGGKVEFLPLAPIADALIVPVSIKDKVGLVAVDAKAAGVCIGEPLMSLGLRNCPVADVEFKDVRVKADAMLTDDAEAGYPALAAGFRAAAAAMAVGVVTGSYEAAKAYARERQQGGRAIADYDMVRLMLVNMAVVAESGNAVVDAMAGAADGERPWPLSDAGLISITEQASRAATDGVQCLGGYGYMQDYGQEKRMRDAKQIESIFGAAPQKRLQLMADILRQEE